MKIRIIVILLFIVGAVASLPAQGDILFGPQFGFYKAKDAVDSRLMGGAAMRIKLSEGFGIEGSINYRQEKYLDGYVTVKNWPVMVSALIYPGPFVYGIIGTGWYNIAIDYSIPTGYQGGSAIIATETMQEFGWHFGAGMELPIGEGAKLFGDVKYVFLNYDFNNFPGSNGLNSNFYVMTVGLLFAL